MTKTMFTKALIIGASGGIGAALVQLLKGQGTEVTELSRSQNGFDITDESAVEAAAKTLNASFDLIVIATGGLSISGVGPEKSIKAVRADTMADQFALNAIGPALCLKHFTPLLNQNGQSVVAVLTARIGSIADNRLGGWISYRAAKAAANQIVRTTAIELKRTNANAICVAVHPGTVATNMTEKYVKNHPSVPPSEAAQNIVEVLSKLTAQDSGEFFAYDGSKIQW